MRVNRRFVQEARHTIRQRGPWVLAPRLGLAVGLLVALWLVRFAWSR